MASKSSCATCMDFCPKSSTCFNPFAATYHSPQGAVYATVRATDVCSLYCKNRAKALGEESKDD